MNTPILPESPEPITPPAVVAPEAPAANLAPATPPAPRRRRRKFALLGFLVVLLAGFASFAGWYLITRKPVTEIPIPVIAAPTLPHYVFSVYGASKPTGVAVTSDGSRIYVTDTGGAGGMEIFDGKGTKVADVKVPATFTGDHTMIYPAIDPATGDVYVSDRPAGAIWVFSGDGLFRRQVQADAALNGWQPLGLAFGPDGYLYVTDLSGPFHRVEVISKDGKLIRTIGQQGQMNFPNGIAFDATGRMFVTDSNDGRLLIFDTSGNQIGVIARGQKQGELGIPRGIAIDDQGLIYIVDMSGHAVQIYDPMATGDKNPKFVGKVGVQGNLDGAFQFPNGVAVDARARIYVTDQVNDRVQVWSY